MPRQLSVAVGVVVMVVWSCALAKPKIQACSLLTAAEVGDAVGTPAGPAQDTLVIPEGPPKGETMRSCIWRLEDGQSTVSVSVMRVRQGAPREASLARLSQPFDRLKTKGWTEEQTPLGNAMCATLTPPTSDTKAPTMVGCLAAAKQVGIAIQCMTGQGTQMAPEKIKALLDTAIRRLP